MLYINYFNLSQFTHWFYDGMYNLMGSHYVTIYYVACNRLATALVDLRMVIYWPKHVVLSIFVLKTLHNVLCLTVHNIRWHFRLLSFIEVRLPIHSEGHTMVWPLAVGHSQRRPVYSTPVDVGFVVNKLVLGVVSSCLSKITNAQCPLLIHSFIHSSITHVTWR